MALIEDETEVSLSANALNALASFYNERDEAEKRFEDLKLKAEEDYDKIEWSMDAFGEDWNASQFWYDNPTAQTLARVLLSDADSSTRIAVVSAPSAFVQLKNLMNLFAPEKRPMVTLLEYDTRFAVFPEFVEYDFSAPLRLPQELKGQFDRVLVDPPFLSEDCQTKAAMTVRWLSKAWPPSAGLDRGKESWVIACTGERMGSLLLRLYARVGVRTTTFLPVHAKGLSNEFRCYANVEGDDWRFVDDVDEVV